MDEHRSTDFNIDQDHATNVKAVELERIARANEGQSGSKTAADTFEEA
jgi:hypothetical protein